MLNKVLFPVHYNHNYSQILQAVRFFYSNGMEWVYLFHVMASGFQRTSQVEKWLNDIAKRLYLEVGVKVISGVTEGHVASDIVAKANEIDADLIYIPVTRKNVVQLTLLGSTSRDVMRLTDKPTFVHKTRPKLVEEKPIENMMFATDFSKGTEKAKERLKDYSRAAKNLILIYVGRRAADPMSEHKRRGVVNNKLGELNEELTPYFESIKTVNEIGNPSKVILSYSSKMDVDLVVLGKFTRRSMPKFTGSTAENVIHKAESSILLVP